MKIEEQVIKVKKSLEKHQNVRIVAAVKYLNVEDTKKVIDAGILEIGENRKDTFQEKYNLLKDYKPNIIWHYFGIIKLYPKLTSDFVNAIDYYHSLESIDVANALNRARTREEPIKCFVRVNIANVRNVAGLDESKVIPFVKSLSKYEHLEIVGLMTTAKYTFDEDLLVDYFEAMKELQTEIQSLNIPNVPCKELSMGMSNDYLIAVEHGATFVRLGKIFLA